MDTNKITECHPILQVIIPNPDFSCMDVEWVNQEFQCFGSRDVLILVPFGCNAEKKELLSIHFDKLQDQALETRLEFVISVFSIEEKLMRMAILYLMHHFPEDSETKIIFNNYGSEGIEGFWQDLSVKVKNEMKVTH
ncbi:MAG: hypothetical protein LBE27_02360 [Deltaproteobacteria bacterium]|jgi:hypothetical protein|nr:hypothetical protein [Deltaproteobacteria bacterium]